MDRIPALQFYPRIPSRVAATFLFPILRARRVVGMTLLIEFIIEITKYLIYELIKEYIRRSKLHNYDRRKQNRRASDKN